MKHLTLFEGFENDKKHFNDAEILYWTKLWNSLNIKYRNNQFFSKLWKQMTSKKHLTKKQWTEMEFLLKNGKSRYETGVLPPNY